MIIIIIYAEHHPESELAIAIKFTKWSATVYFVIAVVPSGTECDQLSRK